MIKKSAIFLLHVGGLAFSSVAWAGPKTLQAKNPCNDQTTKLSAKNFDASAYLTKTQGKWVGTARGIKADGSAAPEFLGSFTYSYDAASNVYQQTNVYASGTEDVVLHFKGKISDGLLVIDSDSYGDYGSCAWMLDENTMGFYSRKIDFDGSDLATWELISVTSETTRVRNAQKIRNGAFDGMIFISETRE